MNKEKTQSPWLSGHVNWYDPYSGRGSIIGDDGNWYRIHEFSELQIKKDKLIKEKTRLEFELAKDSIHPIIKKVRAASLL